jgi:hypothetical protein
MSMSRETKLLVEIKDIRDELSILKIVLKVQETIMSQMWGIVEEAKIKLGKEQDPHASYKCNRILEIHLFRIKKMEGLANKAYDEVYSSNTGCLSMKDHDSKNPGGMARWGV